MILCITSERRTRIYEISTIEIIDGLVTDDILDEELDTNNIIGDLNGEDGNWRILSFKIITDVTPTRIAVHDSDCEYAITSGNQLL